MSVVLISRQRRKVGLEEATIPGEKGIGPSLRMSANQEVMIRFLGPPAFRYSDHRAPAS